MIYPPDKLDSKTTLTQPLLASSMLCIKHTPYLHTTARDSLSLSIV